MALPVETLAARLPASSGQGLRLRLSLRKTADADKTSTSIVSTIAFFPNSAKDRRQCLIRAGIGEAKAARERGPWRAAEQKLLGEGAGAHGECGRVHRGFLPPPTNPARPSWMKMLLDRAIFFISVREAANKMHRHER